MKSSTDDFAKLDLRVGTIVSAMKHPKGEKLLVFQVKMGSETRQILSGVAEYYKPEDTIGQKVVVVANLAPRMLRGNGIQWHVALCRQYGRWQRNF